MATQTKPTKASLIEQTEALLKALGQVDTPACRKAGHAATRIKDILQGEWTDPAPAAEEKPAPAAKP